MTPIEACVHCLLDARRHLQAGGSREDPYHRHLVSRAASLRRLHDMGESLAHVPRDLPRQSIFIDIDGEPEDRTPPTSLIDRITTFLWGRPQ